MVHIFTITTVAIVALIGTTSALPTFPAKIPNGENVDGVKALGHINVDGGGPRNDFGKAFDAAGREWTVELCQEDSDGDGQTNGEELGDPCCEWTISDPKLNRVSDLSHPGLASSKTDPTILANVKCTAGNKKTDDSSAAVDKKTDDSSAANVATMSIAAIGAAVTALFL